MPKCLISFTQILPTFYLKGAVNNISNVIRDMMSSYRFNCLTERHIISHPLSQFQTQICFLKSFFVLRGCTCLQSCITRSRILTSSSSFTPVNKNLIHFGGKLIKTECIHFQFQWRKCVLFDMEENDSACNNNFKLKSYFHELIQLTR